MVFTYIKISANDSDSYATECSPEKREGVKNIKIEDPHCLDLEKYGRPKCAEDDLTIRIYIEASMPGS